MKIVSTLFCLGYWLDVVRTSWRMPIANLFYEVVTAMRRVRFSRNRCRCIGPFSTTAPGTSN